MEIESGDSVANPVAITRVPTDSLTPESSSAIRALLWAAFDDPDDAMTEDDWQRAMMGVHFVADVEGEIVAYASVSERGLEVDGHPVRAGYVEALATAVGHQGRGIGSRVMREVNAYIRERFELGALGTGRHRFYERLGWLTWKGQTWVQTADGPRRSPDEDGYILVLPTPTSPQLDLAAPLGCDQRPGDSW